MLIETNHPEKRIKGGVIVGLVEETPSVEKPKEEVQKTSSPAKTEAKRKKAKSK